MEGLGDVDGITTEYSTTLTAITGFKVQVPVASSWDVLRELISGY